MGLLDPDEGETISGNVTLRAMIAGRENYDIIILINGSLNATYVPFEWNTTKLADGWWNVTVIAIDVATNNVSQDAVIVYVKNTEDIIPRALVSWEGGDQSMGGTETIIEFDTEGSTTTH